MGQRFADMTSRLALLLLTMAMMAGTSAEAQDLDGPARGAVLRALDGEERQNLLPGSRIVYGDFTGDGQRDAVAFVYYDLESGNGVGLTTLLLESTPAGFRLISRPDGVTGESPRNIRFMRGRVSFVTTTSRSAAREWTFEIPLRQAAAPPLAAVDGPLTRRYCDQVGGSVLFRNRTLVIDAGGVRDTFRNVTFEGCNGARCSYLQEATDMVWTVIVRPNGLSMRGPTSAVALRPVDLEFGRCQ